MQILPRIDIDGPPTDEHISVDYYCLGGDAWFRADNDNDGEVTVTSLFHQVPNDLMAAAYGEIDSTVLEALNEYLTASLQSQS